MNMHFAQASPHEDDVSVMHEKVGGVAPLKKDYYNKCVLDPF